MILASPPTAEPLSGDDPGGGVESSGLALVAARVRAVEMMPYLASALFALQPVASEIVPTAGVDRRWRLYWNPRWCDGLGVDELAAVLLHEVGHLLRRHGERFADLGHPAQRARLFNIAGDAAINADLVADRLRLPVGSILPHHLRRGRVGMTTEELYRGLLDEESGEQPRRSGSATEPTDTVGSRPAADSAPPSARFNEGGCGSAADGSPRPWELPDEAEQPTPGIDELRAHLVRQQVAAEVMAAEAIGTVPGGLTRWATRELEPAVDWRVVLARSVRRELTARSGRSDYSYGRPSRRAASLPDVVLPSMVSARPPVVCAVIDTSGSMTGNRLDRCVVELDGILRTLRRTTGAIVRVVACDTKASPVRSIRSVDDVELVGGGGTDLRPAIRVAATTQPRPDVVVTMTDGDTPWDGAPPSANRHAHYLAVLVDGERPLPSWIRPLPVAP